jgi:hypothetical protein
MPTLSAIIHTLKNLKEYKSQSILPDYTKISLELYSWKTSKQLRLKQKILHNTYVKEITPE